VSIFGQTSDTAVDFLALPVTKTDVAYRQIRKEIIEGALPPDTVIDQETLAERLGLSTTPVREALRLLESEKLVISRRHRQTVVTPLNFELLEETYAVRLNLDPLAVSMAAVHATETQRELIRELARADWTGATPAQQLHANRELHRKIYSASGNSVLTEILDGLWDRTDRYRMVLLTNAADALIAHDEHSAIVQAVTAGRVEVAAELMREHVAESLKRLRTDGPGRLTNPGTQAEAR
jgi:DNA-binding GntR family transcriptional regulator